MKKIISIFIIGGGIFISCNKKAIPVTTTTTTEKTETVTTPVAASKEAPVATEETVKSITIKTDDLVAQGHRVYDLKCGKCHALKNIGDYKAESWPGILKDMMPKAKLNEEEQRQVTAYVMENAKK